MATGAVSFIGRGASVSTGGGWRSTSGSVASLSDVECSSRVFCSPVSCSNSGFCGTLRRKRGLLKLRGRRDCSRRTRLNCKAYARKSSDVKDYGYDLYELLGVEHGAASQEIKGAYRWLQKRCHPDIAGPAGHDMAILLNDAYSVLSDPHRRASYDAMRAEKAEFEGYTGEPLYSKWYGPSEENRAVFVEESKCVGCLKCALIAPNTFAIEKKYGRARAIGQWGDDETTIRDAIRACPVDCISWVDKVMLPALEFVMSKQPRLLVGIDHYSYVGVRVENVFNSAERFLRKCALREEENRKSSSIKETPAQRKARMAAAEGIHARAGRWWHHLMDNQSFANMTFSNLWDPTSTRVSQAALIPLAWVESDEDGDGGRPPSEKFSPLVKFRHEDADLEALFEAATKWRREGTKDLGKGPSQRSAGEEDEYWTPTTTPVSCPISESPLNDSTTTPFRSAQAEREIPMSNNTSLGTYYHEYLRTIMSSLPALVSVTAAMLVGLTSGSDAALSESTEIMGPLPATISSGMVMKMFLAATVWYAIGALACGAALYISFLSVNLRQKSIQK